MKRLTAAIIILLLAIVVYTQLTFFVVQPIGAAPKGVTLLILRLNTGKFIDSADAMCVRIQDGVSLLCRGMAIGAVAKNSTVLARLPYSRTLYLLSTSGKEYGQPEPSVQQNR